MRLIWCLHASSVTLEHWNTKDLLYAMHPTKVIHHPRQPELYMAVNGPTGKRMD